MTDSGSPEAGFRQSQRTRRRLGHPSGVQGRITGLVLTLLLVVLSASCRPANGEVTQEQVAASPQVSRSQATTVSAPAGGNWWQPKAGLSWQWQLEAALDLEVAAGVWDVDLETPKSSVDDIHNRGARAICYISVGSYEDWRIDAGQFPEEVLGDDYEGWPGERWLDIRRIDLLAPIMLARFDECAEKGFDGVEPDNMEIYTSDSGFPLTYEDQLRYATLVGK